MDGAGLTYSECMPQQQQQQQQVSKDDTISSNI